jgi:hypothetical protein
MPHRGLGASVNHSLTAFRLEADHRLEELIDRFGPSNQPESEQEKHEAQNTDEVLGYAFVSMRPAPSVSPSWSASLTAAWTC